MNNQRTLRLALAALACGALASCSTIGGIFGGNRKGDVDDDKSGRIDLVLGDPAIEADPAFASVSVVLPEARRLESWPQSGSRPSKVVGHVDAARDLKIAWRASAGSGTSTEGALTAAPIASADAVFILDAEQRIHALDLDTGARLWRRELKSGARRDKRGLGGGLAFEEGVLIVASGFGTVSALSAETGDIIWERRLGSPMTGSPTIKDGLVFVSSQNNEVFAMDFTTGNTEWSDQAIAEPARVLSSPSPAAIEDIVVAPYSSGEVIAYLAANGRRLWSDALTRSGRFTPISAINDVASRPILASGLVFAASQSGLLAAIDGRSGARVWAQPIASVQAPALAGEFLFISGIEGDIVCLAAGSGGVIWSTKLPRFENERKRKGRITYAGPVIASGRVIVISSDGELIALSPQTGEELERVRLRQDVFIEPIVAQDKLIVLTDNARLIAIE